MSPYTLDEAWSLEPFGDGYAVLGVWCGMLGWFYVTREALVKAGMFRISI